MVDETILGCVFTRLQGSEKSLFCSENLHRGGRVLRQIQKGPLATKQQVQVGVINRWLVFRTLLSS